MKQKLDLLVTRAARAVRQRDDPERVIRENENLIEEVYEIIYLSVYPDFAEQRYDAFVKAPAGLLEKWLAAARAFVASRPVKKRIRHVLDTTISWVNELTAEALSEGLSSDQIARRIVEQWTEGDVGLVRAERIARTETISAANAGSHQGAVDSGLDMKRFWISALDGRVRDAHSTALHPELSEPIPMNQPFIVDGESLMYPGDPSGSAANTIQCRCVEGYEVL